MAAPSSSSPSHEAAQQNMRRLFELFNFGRSEEPLHYGDKS